MLATTSLDRTVRVWWTEHFESKDHKFVIIIIVIIIVIVIVIVVDVLFL